ncbi:MAG: hypothetical protein Q9187_007634 [Circinaria calcarea]
MNPAERVGGGLVEISAVATIIGAPIAEALMHGLKGACGMVWAPVSSFGQIHVAKACLSASVPDWLREAMGLRNAVVDKAIGVMLPIDQAKQSKNRVDLGDACAIRVASQRSNDIAVFDGTSRGTSSNRERTLATQFDKGLRQVFRETYTRGPLQWFESKAMAVFTLDQNSKLVLDTVQATDRGEAILVHQYLPDVDGIIPGWKDWAILLASLVKLLEVFCLWRLGSKDLWYWTMIGWAHAFVAAIVLQSSGLGRDHPLKSNQDILAGVLPTPIHAGEDGKLIIGIPSTVRRHSLWKTSMIVGTIFNSVGLFGIFIFLNQEPATIIYIWIGFQGLWLISRSVIYYFVEGAAAGRQSVVVGKTWEERTIENRQHAMTLLSELSKYRITIHPRGADWIFTGSLPETVFDRIHQSVEIKAVTGDPLIRSAVWFTGANMNNSELYDAAVAFISVGDALLAVPCIRVYACECLFYGLRERGASHVDCNKLEWLYFFPTNTRDGDRWIYARSVSGVGSSTSEVLTDDELHRRFELGRWKISLRSLAELRAALVVSRDAAPLLIELVKGCFDKHQKEKSPLGAVSREGIVNQKD